MSLLKTPEYNSIVIEDFTTFLERDFIACATALKSAQELRSSLSNITNITPNMKNNIDIILNNVYFSIAMPLILKFNNSQINEFNEDNEHYNFVWKSNECQKFIDSKRTDAHKNETAQYMRDLWTNLFKFFVEYNHENDYKKKEIYKLVRSDLYQLKEFFL